MGIREKVRQSRCTTHMHSLKRNSLQLHSSKRFLCIFFLLQGKAGSNFIENRGEGKPVGLR